MYVYAYARASQFHVLVVAEMLHTSPLSTHWSCMSKCTLLAPLKEACRSGLQVLDPWGRMQSVLPALFSYVEDDPELRDVSSVNMRDVHRDYVCSLNVRWADLSWSVCLGLLNAGHKRQAVRVHTRAGELWDAEDDLKQCYQLGGMARGRLGGYLGIWIMLDCLTGSVRFASSECWHATALCPVTSCTNEMHSACVSGVSQHGTAHLTAGILVCALIESSSKATQWCSDGKQRWQAAQARDSRADRRSAKWRLHKKTSGQCALPAPSSECSTATLQRCVATLRTDRTIASCAP